MSDNAVFNYRDNFTIIQFDAIYCDNFQALSWSKMFIISSKICPGSAYVEIFSTEMPYFTILQQKSIFMFFNDKNAMFQVS